MKFVVFKEIQGKNLNFLLNVNICAIQEKVEIDITQNMLFAYYIFKSSMSKQI